MYNDNELIKCQLCEGLGIVAPDISGVKTFFHKIPSKLSGYFTFTADHKN